MDGPDQTQSILHCTQCCQPLAPGQPHPAFFAQSKLDPDPTDVFDVHQELAFLMADIGTMLELLYDREMNQGHTHRDETLMSVLSLTQRLQEEAERRAVRLRNAGMYWQDDIENRNDGSLFPDLPAPRPEHTPEQEPRQ